MNTTQLLRRLLPFLALAASLQLTPGYYDPAAQRWINRDPIGEAGAVARLGSGSLQGQAPRWLYRFVGNAPLHAVDSHGLTIWKCSRTSEFGVGRHAYLWDDRAGPIASRSCGQGASSGSLGPWGTGLPNDQGPTTGDPGWLWDWTNSDYQCVPIAGTAGFEDEIMQECREHVNDGVWCPQLYDCHDRCNHFLTGYEQPPLDRWNPGDGAFLLFLSTHPHYLAWYLKVVILRVF